MDKRLLAIHLHQRHNSFCHAKLKPNYLKSTIIQYFIHNIFFVFTFGKIHMRNVKICQISEYHTSQRIVAAANVAQLDSAACGSIGFFFELPNTW
jgi:hypothetical protein